ncbi:MAG: hypothetical protein FJW39_17575 [Acidobacteria bacterium]|nr:hypothetical protein [Acidobacteriota bacterium]
MTRSGFLALATASLPSAGSLSKAQVAPAPAPPAQSCLDLALARRRPPKPINVRTRRQLLFDYTLVHRGTPEDLDYPRNIRWSVGKVEKSPSPVYSPRLPWERGCFYWPRVLKDGGKYRLWYNAAADETIGGVTQEYDKVAYAESDDGVTWRTPDLGIIEWNGSKKNNIVFNCERPGGGQRAHGPCVFIDPTAPPAERYKMVYGDSPGQRPPLCSLAVLMGAYSPDGLHWRRYPEAFMIHPDAQTGAGYDPYLGKYVAYVRGGSDYGEVAVPSDPIERAARGRAVRRIESSSFRSWTPPEPCVAPDDSDPLDLDFYTNGYSEYPWADRVHFMFLGAFRGGAQETDIQVAVSRDNRRWTRPVRQPFITNGPKGSYDAGMIHVGPGIVDLGGDRMAVYTQCAALGKDSVERQKSPYHGFTLGRAVFPRDRIIGIEAQREQGFFSTRALVFDGSQLAVNVEPTGPNARLAVELVSAADSKPCANYTFSDCRPIDRDGVDLKVSWQHTGEVGSWAGKPVRLRFRFEEMRIYAFQFLA